MLAAATLILLAFAASGARGFSIAILQGNPVAISTGLDLLLTCYPVDVSMYVQLEWWGPDTILISSTAQSQRRYIQQDPTDPRKVQLIVRSVQAVDAGTYICRYNPGVDAGGQIIQVSINVQVTQLITVVDCTNYQYLVYGLQSRMIVCIITGNPAPTKVWWFSPSDASGNPTGQWTMVQSSAKYSYMNNGLQVYNIAYTDAGWYRLQASIESAGQSVIQDILVTVDTFPSVTGPISFIEPYNIPATGYDLWMQCNGFSGNPVPSIHWYWNYQYDRELTQTLSSRYYADIYAGMLQIKQLGVNDAGVYTCRASSRNGYADYNYTLTVIMRPQVLQYLNITAELNSNAQLICDVSGSAPLNIFFWKTGDPWNPALPGPYVVGTQPDDSRISVSVTTSVNPQNYNQYTAKLNIARVQPNDTGNYSCIAQNAGGNTTQNGTLIAVYTPRIQADLPTQAFGYAGNSTNLTCIAWGNPAPEWRWYRRQAEILTGINDTFRIFQQNFVRYTVCILQIKVRYTDEWFIYDQYTCNATNDHGTTGFAVYFRQAQPAAPPTVTQAEVTASGITLSITPPTDTGGTWITGYAITYNTGGDQWRPMIWYPPEDTIEIRYLNANQIYTFRVSALNPVGPGQAATVQFTTLSTRVPYPCIVVSPSLATSPYSYNVRWSMKSSGGAVVLLYLIKIRPVTVSGTYNNSTLISDVLSDWIDYPVTALPLMDEFLIRNLQPNTYYQVQVLAQNSKGFSEPSISIFKTQPADPFGRPELLVLAAPSLVPSRFILLPLACAAAYFSISIFNA